MRDTAAVTTDGVSRFYAGWHLANRALIDAMAPLTAEQLALPVGTWKVWQLAAHIAGARVYWLCHVFGEPGVETTPFPDPNVGWEDDVSRPRDAGELVGALTSSWRIVEHALETWTPATLEQEARRTVSSGVQIHTRQSVLMRLITHDAYHCGEIAQALGPAGLGGKSPNGPIDMWAGLSRRE